jgi:alkylhydroperoxidase family enzyme
MDNAEPFLTPIENPRGPIMKLAYAMTRRRYGKVLTPLKVHSARLPAAFGVFYSKVSELDKKLRLPALTALLIREQVARINICTFCTDIGRWASIQAAMSQEKFDALEHYATSPRFSQKERAALDYATELTKTKTVRSSTFDRLRSYYTEREICEIVWLVASEHLYNLTNVGLNIHSDRLCDLRRAKRGRKAKG